MSYIHRLFCFSPQRDAVSAMLDGLGVYPLSQLRPVMDPQQLMGHGPGCAFVHVANHGTKLPDKIVQAIRVYGLIEVSINDECMRSRFYRRPATEPPSIYLDGRKVGAYAPTQSAEPPLGVAGGADSRSPILEPQPPLSASMQMRVPPKAGL